MVRNLMSLNAISRVWVLVVGLMFGSISLGYAAETPAPKPRVQKSASGLEYIIVEEGTGTKPKKGQRVKVHYTGKLKDGTVFDTSKDRGPIVFVLGVGQVIAGWDEGIADMKIGGKRQLIIPPGLAYGASGRPPKIPPQSTLIFDVELVGVE